MRAQLFLSCLAGGLTACLSPCAAQPGRLVGHQINIQPYLGLNFIDIASGNDHSLFLTEDRTIMAGGLPGTFGQGIAPPGRFIGVAVGPRFSVALREDGTLLAWGDSSTGILEYPAGEFVSVTGGGIHALATRADGTVATWGVTPPAPPGPFLKARAGGYSGACVGIRSDGSLEAWGLDNSYGELDVPAGRFIDVAAGTGWGVALREDGTLVHWGRNNLGQGNVPSGTFIALGPIHANLGAAIRTDGSIAVWGYQAANVQLPHGRFTKVSAGERQVVAIRACYANCDGSIVAPILNVDDFTCFINQFAQAMSQLPTLSQPLQWMQYANCDGSTTAPILNIDDFTCFINEFARGCP
jgi:hypothetical protein